MLSGIFGSIHSIDMFRMGDSDLNMTHRCCYNLKDVLKQMMLQHEAIFRQQVYDLHRLYSMQQQLMNDLAVENSCGWSKDQYAASISSQKDTDIIVSRFCSSAVIDPLRPFYASSSAFVAECCSLCEQKRNARYNEPGHLTFDLQLHSGIYTSDAGSQSASNCIEMKDCVVNNLKITIFAENEECRKGGTGRIMFCKDINLELPADKLTLEDAEASSSDDESQANAARIEPRSLLHSVSELPYLRATNSEGQDPLAFDFGHNAGPVSRSTMNQSCGSSKAFSIDLNIPQIGESPSMCSDPLILSSTTASSSCGINDPTESVTDQSTRLPSNAWIPGRDVHAEVFGSTVLLPPQPYSSCNQNDMEMKHTRSSLLPINDSSRLKNIHANLLSGSLVFGRERMEMEMANGGQCKKSFLETSVVTSNFLPKEGGETSTQSVAEKHYKEDPVSSTGNEDFAQVDNHPGVFCIPYGTSDSKSVEDKSGAEQVIELDKRDISSEEHPSSLEEFQVVQAELSVDKCSIEKLEVLEHQACECFQEKYSESSKDCFHVQEVQQQQEAVVVDIIIQNAAEALIRISQEKPAGTSKLEYNGFPNSEMAKDESGYSSDSYVSHVLQLPEINTEDCSSFAKPVGKETTIGNNTSRLKLRRRLMDFQRDVLPCLVRLSRHEICEDTHMMGELIRCTEANGGGRRGKWFMPTRSRRSRHH